MQDAAKHMLDELEHQWLEVVKIPTADGGYVRVTNMHNAEWYQDFCASYSASPRRRLRAKHDTLIKREATIRGLKEIIAGRIKSLYAQRLVQPVIEYYDRHLHVPF